MNTADVLIPLYEGPWEVAVPGKQVKSWPMYERLREKGLSKESAARITNASEKATKEKQPKKKK